MNGTLKNLLQDNDIRRKTKKLVFDHCRGGQKYQNINLTFERMKKDYNLNETGN